LTQVPALASQGNGFEYRHEQEQRDRNVHCEGMETAEELGELGALTAIWRSGDQQNQ
jgi:hypothetical protein